MPGHEVKDWKMYHALREQGHSKEAAARITNANAARVKKRALRRRLKNAHRRAKVKGS